MVELKRHAHFFLDLISVISVSFYVFPFLATSKSEKKNKKTTTKKQETKPSFHAAFIIDNFMVFQLLVGLTHKTGQILPQSAETMMVWLSSSLGIRIETIWPTSNRGFYVGWNFNRMNPMTKSFATLGIQSSLESNCNNCINHHSPGL